MSILPHGVRTPAVTLVADEVYPKVLTQLIRQSAHFCWCSIFIVDVDPTHDQDLNVFSILKELQAATWRGVNVRLLIGGSRNNFQIAASAQGAHAICRQLGISSRWLTSRDTRGSHAKMVRVDDHTLLGSHNWSPGAFTGQIQDSVLVDSPGIAAFMATMFEEQWARALGGR